MGDNLCITSWSQPAVCVCDRCIKKTYEPDDCNGEAAFTLALATCPIDGGERGMLYLGRRGNLIPGGVRPAGELIPGNLGGGRYGDADTWTDYPLIVRGIPDSYGGSDE